MPTRPFTTRPSGLGSGPASSGKSARTFQTRLGSLGTPSMLGTFSFTVPGIVVTTGLVYLCGYLNYIWIPEETIGIKRTEDGFL